MASRGLSAGIITALGGSHVESWHLVRMDFITPLYYTNAPYDIDYDGNTYLSNALISELPNLNESLKIKPNTITLKFGGAALSTHALMLGKYTGVDVYVYEYLPSLTDAFLKWQGIIESSSSSENLREGKSTITWKIANHWINWEATNGRLLNNDYQRRLYPVDVGLEFVDKTDPVIDWWGKPRMLIVNLDTLYTQDSATIPAGDSISARSLPVAYGRTLVKGIPVFRTVSGVNNELLHVAYVLSEGECDSLLDVIFFDEDISYTDPTLSPYIDVEFHSGTPAQTVDTTLDSASTVWNINHTLAGICYVRITYTYNDVWRDGEPLPKFLILGKKVYDPRDTLTKFVPNPALILYDYLTNSVYGKGLAPSFLGDIIDGANYCDTQVYNHDNVGTQSLINKFAFKGVIDTSKTIKKNVELILFTMLGHLPWASGIYHLVIERDDDAGIYTFNEDNIKGTFDVDYEKKDNVIQYTFVDPDFDYNNNTVIAEDSGYLIEDNGIEYKKSYTNKYEDNRYRAINRATTMLKKSRQNLAAKLIASNADAVQLMPGNVIGITRASQGWVDKLFRIEDMSINRDGDVIIDRLSEYEPSVYDWSVGTEFIPPQDSNLISPFTTVAPTNINVESGTNHLLQQSDGTVVTRAYVTWTEPVGGLINNYELEYKIFTDTDYIRIQLGDPNAEFHYVQPLEDSISYDFRLRSVNELGLASDWITTQHLIIGKTEKPSDVVNFTHGFQDYNILLTWDTVNDVDVNTYEIRSGTVWDDGGFVARIDGSEYLQGMAVVGSYDFMIKAVDTSGNYSTNHTALAVTITASSQPVVSLTYAGGDLKLSWTATAESFPITEYEIRYGSTWAGGTYVTRISGTSYDIPVDFGGTETFWVAAIDAAGNESTPGSNTSVIVPPSQAVLGVEVIDNNVLLRWDESTGTLPVAFYEIRKGGVFSSAEVLQSINGTFAMFFENEAGTYTYWVVPVDTAGNYGTEASVAPIINDPPDYILNVDWLSDFSGTKTNCLIGQNGTLLVSVNTTETYQQHFVNNSWDQPSDQIAAGYDYFLQPSPNTASYEETFDYGVELAGTMIKIIPNILPIDGSITAAYTISVKRLIGDSWTDNVGTTQIYATDFRYVKVKIDFTAAGNDDLLEFLSLNVRLDSKIINDGGSGTSNSTDTGGTTVTFNVPFVDVANINVTPNSTSAVVAVVDFTDAPNPTDFKVLLFDTGGSRVTADFSWSARGF